MQQIAVPSRLREELIWASRHFDRKKNRDKRIEMWNRLQDKFVAFWEGAETVFTIPKADKTLETPMANVDVLPSEDGRYFVSVNVTFKNMGISYGFSADQSFPVKRAAAVEGVKQIIAWILPYLETNRISEAEQKEVQKLFKECAAFIIGQRQTSLL